MKNRILLVDDEESILFAFTRILDNSPVLLDTASNFDDAFFLMSKYTYAAIIADLRLTGTEDYDGLLIIKEAKSLQSNALVILNTAYGENTVKNLTYKLGADYYFEKPLSPSKIISVLKKEHIYPT